MYSVIQMSASVFNDMNAANQAENDGTTEVR